MPTAWPGTAAKPELCSGSVAETDLDKVTAFFQEQEQAGNI